MANNICSNLRIGIPIIGGKDWLGGVHYIKSLVEAVGSLPPNERPRIFLVVSDHSLAAIDLHQELFPLLDGIIFSGNNIQGAMAALPSPIIHCPTPEEVNNAVDFFYPLVGDFVPGLCTASWIYDFQHVYLPEFFPPDEITSRNARFSYVAASTKLVVLSSKSAEEDFRRIFPASKAVTRVLSFHSLPSAHWYTLNPSETQQKYSLPDSFLICCNQFWIHKNHRRLFEAMAEVVRSAPDTQLVCTGATSEWRFPNHFSELISFVEKHGLQDRIRILGPIPRIDQIQLMRRSLAVIQPSLFEGWSSVVEEARMLGKTILLSDLSVHYEQAPDYAVYFDRNNAKDLAEKILDLLPRLSPGPDHAREQEARKKSDDLVKQFGWNFCSIAVEAQRLFGKKTGTTFPSQPLSHKTYVAKSPLDYPKISIVTPSFNQGQFLEACIDSILSQNYPNLEYIIMDGGSTDNSLEIIKKYEKYLAYWQSQPDGGQYAAVNEGFGKTTGGIMGWLNSDDRLHSCALRNIAAIFSVRKDVEWIVGQPTWWREDGSLKDVSDKREEWTRKKYLEGHYRWIQQESSYWRRSLWDRAGGYLSPDFSLAADLELWARFFRFAHLHCVDALVGGFREYSGTQKSRLSLGEYVREAEQVIYRERALYTSNPETLYDAPSPITVKEVADYILTCGFNKGLTIIVPTNYTNKSWTEEAKRIFGNDADVAVLPPPSGEGFEKIRFRENILFLGASHHLPGLFDTAGKIRFWNSIPSKKFFYQYEKVLGSFLPDSEERERNVHTIQAEVYAVQDEYDAAGYEKSFGEKALWLPDMISAERIRRGRQYPPLSQRPIDLLFVGKMQGGWYRQRQAILQRIQAFGDAHHLKTVIVDTSYMRFNDIDIIEKDYYSQAKVVVNPIGTGNFFNIRFFETLAAGCICLQQIDNNGLLLKSFQERYKKYNAVYFTTADLEQNISTLFSDLSRFEKDVPHTHDLLLQNDTGETRFQALGIPCERPDGAREKEETAHRSSGKKNYPKISIVTPSYNQGQFLEACIDSILSQNYPNLEYIIMDGGSTDNSLEIIKKYEKYLAYWQSQPDGGQYAAVNEGFRKTTGEIMTWINSDDILYPGSLETVADIFLNFTGVEWIMGRSNGIVENTKQFWIMDDLILWSREHYLKRQYKNPYIQQEGTFWKRSLWEKAGGTLDIDLKLAGDMELWARFFRYAQLYSVDALLGAFRTHSAQKTAISAEPYHREAEQIIDREIAFYNQSADKTLLPAPPPISAAQIAALRGQTLPDDLSEIRGEEIPGVKVSAIVSTYNSERFMRGCLEDLVNQTLYEKGELEIIVVDSGSEQNESAVVREFQQKHRGIHYLRTERRETVYAAWNKGIKAASGRYITNANTDDRHRRDALEVMCNVLENDPDVGLVYADVIITETENETFENHTRTGQYQWPDFDRTALSVGCFIGPQPIWRKSLHTLCGYFDESFSASGDWEFWLRIAEGAKFLHVREYLGLYLRSDKSLEHQNAGKRIEEDRSIYKTYIPRYLPAYDEYFTGLTGTDPDPVHVYRYGQVLAAFDRYDEAISLYESFAQRNPAYQGFHFLLNDLKNAKARRSAAQSPPAAPLPEEVMAYVNEADRHIANNDLSSAREAIKQALQYTSGHPQLAAMLSNMLDNLGSPGTANEFPGTKGKDR